MAKETTKNETVCLTGANDFIGSWLVRTLLDNPRYTIHATIFPSSDSSHLITLHPHATSRLHLFQANLLDPAAISLTIQGCSNIFHVASPCTLDDPEDPHNDLLHPALQGTLNVLQAAKRFNVKRVVLTSSISAMVPNPTWRPGKPFDESSWTDVEYCRSRGKWYPVSKTEAEKAAREFIQNNGGVDVVAILPATCLGTLLQPWLNGSCGVLQRLMMGSRETQECYWLGAVHVKDVAKAHVLLYETPDAAGRDIYVPMVSTSFLVLQELCELYPDFTIHSFKG